MDDMNVEHMKPHNEGGKGEKETPATGQRQSIPSKHDGVKVDDSRRLLTKLPGGSMPTKEQIGDWAEEKGLVLNAKSQDEVESVEWGYQLNTRRGSCVRIYHTNWISVAKPNALDLEALKEISVINPNPLVPSTGRPGNDSGATSSFDAWDYKGFLVMPCARSMTLMHCVVKTDALRSRFGIGALCHFTQYRVLVCTVSYGVFLIGFARRGRYS